MTEVVIAEDAVVRPPTTIVTGKAWQFVMAVGAITCTLAATVLSALQKWGLCPGQVLVVEQLSRTGLWAAQHYKAAGC